MTLGEKIQFMRKKAGMSQEELAEAIGVSRQAVSKWETGESAPEVGKLLALSRAFGVTADWLISDGGPDEPSAPDRYREEPRAEPQEPERPAQSASGVPGALFRRFGWLSGVYVAVVGAVFTAVGALARYVSGLFFRQAVSFDYVESVGFGGPDLSRGDVFIGGFTAEGDFINMGKYTPVISTGERIFNAVSGFAIGFGLVLLVGGIVLALVLRQYKNKV